MTEADETWVEHRDRLMRFVLARGIQSDDAEDIVHDVLAKVLQPGGGPKDSARLVPWLYQVLRNAIVDHWRRKRPTEELPEEIGDTGGSEGPPESLLSCLEPFLARLDPPDAAVLRQADGEGKGQAEIAESLGLSLSGAKSRIQRARAKVLEMYRACCMVELNRRGGVMDHQPRACPPAPAGCGGDVCAPAK